MDVIVLALVIVALILAVIELVQAGLRSLGAWALVCIAVALLIPALGALH